jgi:hypothetical protein
MNNFAKSFHAFLSAREPTSPGARKSLKSREAQQDAIQEALLRLTRRQ